MPRNRFILPAILLLLVSLASSCKKDEGNTLNLPLTGTWQVLSEADFTYLVLDGEGMSSILEEGPYGLHDKRVSPYTADAQYISISFSGGGSTEMYTYNVSNDTLYLNNPVRQVVLKKAAAVDPSTWVKTARLTDEHPVGIGIHFGPLDWDGTNFIISNLYYDKLYKLSSAGYQLIDSLNITQKAVGLATTGADVWVNNYTNDTKLRKIDFTTGLLLATSSDAPSPPFIMSSQGNDIWFFTDNQKLYTYNTLTDVFTLQANLTGFPLGAGGGIPPDMVIVNGHAYICAYGYIIRFDLTTKLVTDTYQLEQSRYIMGIAHNGTDFYALTIGGFASAGDMNVKIHKLQF